MARDLVIDASAILNSLARVGAVASQAREVMTGRTLHAPHLLDLEVANSLRRHVSLGIAEASRAEQYLQLISRMAIRRYPHSGLLARVWRLRENFSSYDASYVALAEALRAPLLTSDLRLASAAERYCAVERLGAE
ncbi:MAG: type II toxin-antitoxin system VapC family toxin [Cryobacterium sp.]|nr:type II toxin-antitoxin system VapC family toxin [Cryobacterium sp.]MBX3089045.1 type II toxin-antitoxin system VapC family toxin [Cryobacterium sp.]MBX3117157.1 type II toxin-antitoxin system VapC family toxin [Cryobacterium sp.]MCO5294280.1 type II toxin-antitoxin system VapC family toxin [Homoserinimonas sp.]MCW5944345.1 type II toxin-antitoxin system VapC family toxin [Cryobacterium sp.]